MASISSNLKDLQARVNEALKEASVKGKRKDSLLQSLEQLRKAHFDIIDVVEKYKLAYPGLAQKFTQTTARADSLEKSIKAKFSSSYFATRTASEVQDNESTLLTNWNSDKAVESIFKAEFDLATNAAKTFFRDTLEKAKRAAVGIIHTLRDFVAETIQTFAQTLKTLVSALLVFFPTLRDRVNQAIDGVVQATLTIVEKVAQGLEKTVAYLADKAGGLLSKVMDLFETFVMTQVQIAQALLS